METLKDIDFGLFNVFNNTLHRTWLDPVFWLITSTGLGWIQAILGLPFAIKRSTRPLFIMILANVAVVGMVSNGIKRLVPRMRPSNLIYAHPAQDELIYSRSFPSGHTTTSFAIATSIVLFTRGTKWAWTGYLAIVWALLVGFSRIYRGVHWPTDVLGGMCLGIAGGTAVYLLVDSINTKRNLALETPS